MSRKKRFIEKLTEKEISLLEQGYKKGKSHTYRCRCRAILLSFEGWTCSELSTHFDASLVTIYSWLDRWEAGGIDAMSDKKGRGRKPILDTSKDKHVKVVINAIDDSPSNINKALSNIKKELGTSMSKKTLKRFLKNLSEDGSDLEKAP